VLATSNMNSPINISNSTLSSKTAIAPSLTGTSCSPMPMST
jgi:hypothetical protein